MKVLLVNDVKKLGWLGDVVEVNDGYARNYLIPQGLAVAPTDGNLKSIVKKKAAHAERRSVERKRLEVVAKAVEGAEVVISSKANELGHLFGSVTEADIAGNLRSQGFEVADDFVDMGAHIKQVGTSDVKLLFDKDLSATVKVVVVAEKPVEEQTSGETATTADSTGSPQEESESGPADQNS
jgi:large subunit ribosomal protein L9